MENGILKEQILQMKEQLLERENQILSKNKVIEQL